MTVFKKNSADTGMMDTDDLYGYIKLKDFKWVANKAGGATTEPGIETKLFLGPFSITTYNKPTVKVDFVDPTDDDDNDITDLAVEHTGTGGLTLGYKLDPVVLSLGVVSQNDWSQDDPAEKDKLDCHIHDATTGTITPCKEDPTDNLNDENAYAFLGQVDLAIGDDADLVAKVAYAHEYDEDGSNLGIGAKATFDLGDIDPHIAFDAAIPPDGDGNVPFDVGAGLKWDLSPNDDKSYFETSLMMYAPGGAEAQVLGVSATLKEGDDDTGALEGMGASLKLDLNDLTNADNSTWGVTINAHYKVNDIKPFFMVKFSNADGAKTAFDAGLELTMVKHLTAKLMYASADISSGTDKGDVTASLKLKY